MFLKPAAMMRAGEKQKVLIALPAFNEERNIAGLLARMEPWKNDLIVVDDSSEDHTAALVRSLGFICIRRRVNRGLSGFYATARRGAVGRGYTHLIALDADGQHDPEFIPEFMEKLKTFDLVTGNRFHDPSSIPESKIASNLFAILLFREILGLRLPDVACGFRGVALPSIPSEKDYPGFGIIYGMLIRHGLSGRPFGEVRIPALYPPEAPMNTRIAELEGLLSATGRYSGDPRIREVAAAVSRRSDFLLRLADFQFKANFEPPGAYRFITDTEQARSYMIENR